MAREDTERKIDELARAFAETQAPENRDEIYRCPRAHASELLKAIYLVKYSTAGPLNGGVNEWLPLLAAMFPAPAIELVPGLNHS
jgi:hypothetical protein